MFYFYQSKSGTICPQSRLAVHTIPKIFTIFLPTLLFCDAPIILNMVLLMFKNEDDRVEPSEEDARPEGMAFAMRAEAENILLDPAFRRSPIMAKLLQYLLEETLAGRAHLLKSYTVAVDGLDRPTNFDAGDSYARVQVGRLRKMLQAHYAEHAPVDQMCIHLQSGQYSLRMSQLATAYPTLFRPLSAPTGAAVPEVIYDRLVSSASNLQTQRPSAFAKYALYIVILFMLTAAVLGSAYWYRSPLNATLLSPVLELMPVDAGPDNDAKNTSRLVAAMFNDGLPRFKMSRIRILRQEPTKPNSIGNEPVYRMYFQIEEPENSGSTLFLRLTDARSDLLIWSRKVNIDGDDGAMTKALAPLMAEINGPFGVVATHSANLHNDNRRGGYPCLLKYFAFLKMRDSATEKLAATCFEKPVDEQRLRATILATRALFAIESDQDLKNTQKAIAAARSFAESALAADANDGSARFAMARIAFLTRDCMTARFYAHETMKANPYSPIFMAALAAHAPLCHDPKSNEFLDRAFLVANANDTDARLLLAIAAVQQGRADRVLELKHTNVPRNGRNRLNYYLFESILAAADNRKGDAAQYWQQFSAKAETVGSSPDDKLRRIIPSPELRQKVIAYLGRKGALVQKNRAALLPPSVASVPEKI